MFLRVCSAGESTGCQENGANSNLGYKLYPDAAGVVYRMSETHQQKDRQTNNIPGVVILWKIPNDISYSLEFYRVALMDAEADECIFSAVRSNE